MKKNNNRTLATSRRQFLKLGAGAAVAASAGLPMPALAAPTTVLRFSSQQPVNSIYTQAMQMFADAVAKASSGGMEIQLFPNATLGDANQQHAAIQSGTTDMGLSTPAWFARSVKEADVFTLPYIVSSIGRLRSALDGELGQKVFAAGEEAGFKFHGGWLMGGRSMVNKVRPINTPDDVKGLKMRVIGSPVYLAAFTALGATPVSMSPSELYLALQQNVVDGFEYPLPDLIDAKLYEVSKFLSLDEHGTDFFMVGMNKGSWERLSPEQQEIFTAAMKTATDWLWTKQPENIEAAKEKLRTLLTVNDISPENKALFVEATKPVYAQFADHIGPDIVELAVKELGPAQS